MRSGSGGFAADADCINGDIAGAVLVAATRGDSPRFQSPSDRTRTALRFSVRARARARARRRGRCLPRCAESAGGGAPKSSMASWPFAASGCQRAGVALAASHSARVWTAPSVERDIAGRHAAGEIAQDDDPGLLGVRDFLDDLRLEKRHADEAHGQQAGTLDAPRTVRRRRAGAIAERPARDRRASPRGPEPPRRRGRE